MHPCPHCGAAVAKDARFCGACGMTMSSALAATGAVSVPTPALPPRTLDHLVGKVVVGRYRVISKLGAGGMGTVFRAEQTSVKRTIALKVLDPNLSYDPDLVRRFHAEAEVAG